MVYKDSAGKEIHEGDSLMDLTPGFVGEISEVFLDEDEGELAVNQDGTTIYLYEIDTEVSSLIVNEETMNIEKEEDDGEEKCAVIHFAQNKDIIIGVDFGYGNDYAVKTTAKVHEDGRLEILKSERIGRTRDISKENRDRIIQELKDFKMKEE